MAPGAAQNQSSVGPLANGAIVFLFPVSQGSLVECFSKRQRSNFHKRQTPEPYPLIPELPAAPVGIQNTFSAFFPSFSYLINVVDGVSESSVVRPDH